ncbi:hypothetical protein, partial [uncultured Sphingomonas sp.]|uniref:hypothetical protein n=1 Tax=uncultured Sphingomonas sp. TaxID=158754 RepID=UPI0025CD2B0A
GEVQQHLDAGVRDQPGAQGGDAAFFGVFLHRDMDQGAPVGDPVANVPRLDAADFTLRPGGVRTTAV